MYHIYGLHSSAPQLNAESNSECSSNRSSFITANDMQQLHVDTEGHGETAGSGLDYITRLPSPTTLQVPTCDEQLVQGLPTFTFLPSPQKKKKSFDIYEFVDAFLETDDNIPQLAEIFMQTNDK